MDRYYEDILKKVEDLKQKEAFTECLSILEEELSMPYIPREYEDQMIESYNECRSVVRSEHPARAYDEDEIANLLKGSLDEQFLAIEQLKKSNIRHHLKEIQDYLCDHPHYLVRSFLIETLMEQNVSEELSMELDGLEITFTPCFIEPPMESDGVQDAIMQLREWFENDDPSFTMMCVESLVKEAYLKLPFNIESDEAIQLASEIACYVYRASDDLEGMQRFLEEKGLAQQGGYELLLNTHEM